MSDKQEETKKQNVRADDKSIAIGSIDVVGDVSGDISIGHSIGYTADEVTVLIEQISSTFQPRPFDARSPYKGLDVFEEEDAELFFGREKTVEDLVECVRESGTVFITGPSGSGKSSLVRAGLIPALKRGELKNSERWLYETVKPGRDPIEALALAFSRLKSPELGKYFRENVHQSIVLHECAESALSSQKDQRLVLFFDQFEEVFTQVGHEEAREVFFNLLTQAATVEDGRVIILFAMRSDFVSNCAIYPELNALLNQEFVQIGAMGPEELVSAIAQPALRVGLRIDPDLVAQIINDMQGEPGALPLMQFALKDLFEAEQSKGGMLALTREAYLQRGGIQKSLERHADASFAKLEAHEQELARSIFGRLIEIGRGMQDTRRTALFDELIPASASAGDIEAIVRKLADARLITTDELAGKDLVTISHEKLIDAWPWLKKLVNENRDVIALQNQIATDAREWEERRRNKSYLYSGARLANAREQLEAKKLSLSGLAQEFVRAGRKRQRRGQLTLTSTIVIIIAMLTGLSVFSFSQQNAAQAANTVAVAQQLTAKANAEEAQQQAKIAQAGELVAYSEQFRDSNFPLSLLLSIEAGRKVKSFRTRNNSLQNVQSRPQLLRYLFGHSDSVNSVAFSHPDGRILASASSDRTITLWDVATGQRIGQPLTGHSGAVLSVAFSSDGKTLASGSTDGTIILWDATRGQPIGQPLTGHLDGVNSIAFNPDGETLASGSDDGTIILWNATIGESIGQSFTGHSDSVNSVAFSPDGKTLASGSSDETIILWDVTTGQPIGQPLTGHADDVRSVAFSPDGETLASGSDDTTIILWNVATRKPIDESLIGHERSVRSVAFSPDGETIASGGWDGTIILWDVAKGEPIGQPLTDGSSYAVHSVAFSPDGKTLADGHSNALDSVGTSPDGGKLLFGRSDNVLILWDVTTGQPIGTSPDGGALFYASSYDIIILWDIVANQPIAGNSNITYSIAFSPDGKTLVSGNDDGTIILWDVATGQPIDRPLTGHSNIVYSVAFSPDGGTLASGSDDGNIILWDVATGQPIGQPLTGHLDAVNSIAFSPDGGTLASGSDDGNIILWNVATGQRIGQPHTGHSSAVFTVAFSPDGETLASGSSDETIILWDIATGQPIGQPLTGHADDVRSVAFSPDGKIIASGGGDTTITLWNVATRQRIGQPLVGHIFNVESVTFSPDGEILASGSDDGTIILWEVAKGQRIGRSLIGHSNSVMSVAFSPDGETLASGGFGTILILWDMNPRSWLEKNCQRVGRNFTRAEWKQYFPNEEYRKTCEQWPLEADVAVTTTPSK